MPLASNATASAVPVNTPAPGKPAPAVRLSPDSRDWRETASCADYPYEMFFPGKGVSTLPARRICEGCPVKDMCLEWALEANEEFGIWGGTTQIQRKRIMQQRRAEDQDPNARRVRTADPKTLERNEEIRRLRDEENADVNELSERFGLSVNTIYRITGKSRAVSAASKPRTSRPSTAAA